MTEPHGGPRKGAGRKPKAASERRQTLALRILPATRVRLEQLAETMEPDDVLSLGEVVDRLAQEHDG